MKYNKHQYIEPFKSQLANYNRDWDTDEYTNMWVLDVFKFKTNGFFIEAGAAGLSDCHVLEKYYSWSGVCVEPHSDSYQEVVEKGRAVVLNKCLYGQSGTVDFYECSGEIPDKQSKDGHRWAPEQLSGIPAHIRPWHLEDVESTGTVVSKDAVTIEQLLVDYQFPHTVDLLVLDIEGAEQSVLESLPFDKYRFLAIVIEGGSEYRRLLYSNGYVMVENPYRQEPYYDFYYIHHSIVDSYPYRVYSLKELDEIY